MHCIEILLNADYDYDYDSLDTEWDTNITEEKEKIKARKRAEEAKEMRDKEEAKQTYVHERIEKQVKHIMKMSIIEIDIFGKTMRDMKWIKDDVERYIKQYRSEWEKEKGEEASATSNTDDTDTIMNSVETEFNKHFEFGNVGKAIKFRK